MTKIQKVIKNIIEKEGEELKQYLIELETTSNPYVKSLLSANNLKKHVVTINDLIKLREDETLNVYENTDTGNKLFSISNSHRDPGYWIDSFTTEKQALGMLTALGIKKDCIKVFYM